MVRLLDLDVLCAPFHSDSCVLIVHVTSFRYVIRTKLGKKRFYLASYFSSCLLCLLITACICDQWRWEWGRFRCQHCIGAYYLASLFTATYVTRGNGSRGGFVQRRSVSGYDRISLLTVAYVTRGSGWWGGLRPVSCGHGGINLLIAAYVTRGSGWWGGFAAQRPASSRSLLTAACDYQRKWERTCIPLVAVTK